MISIVKPQPPVKISKGIYRHYKGVEYEVRRLAQHSETGEWLVVYRQCYADENWWVSPLESFVQTIEVGGKQVPRFEFLMNRPDKGVD